MVHTPTHAQNANVETINSIASKRIHLWWTFFFLSRWNVLATLSIKRWKKSNKEKKRKTSSWLGGEEEKGEKNEVRRVIRLLTPDLKISEGGPIKREKSVVAAVVDFSSCCVVVMVASSKQKKKMLTFPFFSLVFYSLGPETSSLAQVSVCC